MYDWHDICNSDQATYWHVCCGWCAVPVHQDFSSFGSSYIMEIPDTVVEGHEGLTEGSHEYLVFDKVLLAEAAKAGLYPVRLPTHTGLAGCHAPLLLFQV